MAEAYTGAIELDGRQHVDVRIDDVHVDSWQGEVVGVVASLPGFYPGEVDVVLLDDEDRRAGRGRIDVEGSAVLLRGVRSFR